MRYKRMHLLTTIICLLVILSNSFISAGCAQIKNRELSIQIYLDKNEYHTTDPVIVNVEIINQSKRSLLLNSYLVYNNPELPSPVRAISFNIYTPAGRKQSAWAQYNVRPLKFSDFIIISPGESIKNSYDLQFLNYKFDALGEYSIITCYENAINPQWINQHTQDEYRFAYDFRIAWKGIVCSDSVRFSIVE